VTAQLLYEVGGPAYANPDVTARFDTVHLDQVGRDRVRITGVRGEPAPERLKVSMNYLGGFRNTMALVLTGMDAHGKADVALRTVTGLSLDDCAGAAPAELGPRSTLGVRELHVELLPDPVTDPATTAAAQTHLRITVKDPDPKKVGRPFSSAVVEAALGSYPGMFPTAPPADGTPVGVYWPTTVARDLVRTSVTVDGTPVEVPPLPVEARWADAVAPGESPVPAGLAPAPMGEAAAPSAEAAGGTVRVPLGRLVGARSGDKGGSANVGVWVPDPTEPEAVALAWQETDMLVAPSVDAEHDTAAVWAQDAPLIPDPELVSAADTAYAWLAGFLTPDAVHALLPESADLRVEVHPLPNLRAVNVVVHGLLGRGVADSTRLDPQAKGLGEHLRARIVDVPGPLLARLDPAAP
jgi:hypothetical protein